MTDRPSGTDRGRRATFDRKTGRPLGSGSGAGVNPDDNEEYDDDLQEEEPGVGAKRPPD